MARPQGREQGTGMKTATSVKRFQISPATARFCREYGLLRAEEGDYTDEDVRRLGLVHTLLEAGFSHKSLKRYLDLLDVGEPGRLERARLLRTQRAKLLEEIHSHQRALDRLDYLIREQEAGKEDKY